MKFTTSAAVAAAASTAAAQDSWAGWSSTSAAATSQKTCPAPVTTVTTISTTAYASTSVVYQSTITVPIPEQSPEPVSISPNWVTWGSSSSTSAPVSPSTCKYDQTVTSTSTVTSTIPSTTTVTRSILYVGAQVTGSAEAAWNNWKPDSQGGSGSSSPESSSDSGSGSGYGSGSGSGSGWSGQSSPGGSSGSGTPNGQNGQPGWGQGSWGGSGTGGLVLGSGDDVFHWDAPAPSNTHSGVAPVYTKGPNGWSGPGINGPQPWADTSGSGSNGNSNSNGNGSGSGNGNGNGNSTTGGHGHGWNGTAPANSSVAWGSEASNVTAAFPYLRESTCNSGSDRGQWCNGLSVDTDYYTNYWATPALKARANIGQEANAIANNAASAAGSVLASAAGASGGPSGGNCNYDLTLTRGTWNYDGVDRNMILVNGQYPGPLIECNWGDLVSINVHNNIDGNGTAIHWHGVRQVGTNNEDGVPGVTECAIAPGSSRTYTWRASSYGTSWYHSHWNLQYADGVTGPIVIHGPATADYDVDAGPVMLTDTFGDLSGSAFGDITAHSGPQATENYLMNGKNVQPDLSAGQHPIWKVTKGKKYLFRLINSAAQNMYSVSIDQHKMTVIAGDFVPIQPYSTEWINIGIGQRYDVIVEMDQDVDTYFFRAVTQTLCPSASINSGLGQANGIIFYEGAPESPVPLPTSTLNGGKTAADFRICQDEPLASLVPYLSMDAGTSSAFSASASTIPGGTVSKIQTADEGAVYRWFLNNGAMYVNYTQPTLMSLNQGLSTTNATQYANHITLNEKDQWVYFVIQNQFFAFHPMHLHGHDFAVLGQGDGVFDASQAGTLNFANPMRRDTAMLAGATTPGSVGGYTVIGFQTDNPGAWLMHCHIAWHIDGGLGLQWIERPDDIPAYASQSDFKQECSSYASYEAKSVANQKLSGQSGLRRRDLFFDRVSEAAKRTMSSVVRKSEHGAHRYLDTHKRRGLGDSVKRGLLRH